MKTNDRCLQVLYALVLCYAFIIISGCSGGGGGSDRTGNNPLAALNTDQAAFYNSVYPILERRCNACHSENNSSNIALAGFAHSDVVIAHAVTINRNLIDRDTPQNSVFAARLLVDKHFCWSNCSDDAQTIITAITKWNNLLANEGGANINVGPQTSINAFAQTVHPIAVEHCEACHDGGVTGLSGFASADIESAHDITLNRILADLNNPANSGIVRYLADLEHNCWSDCADNAEVMLQAITEWQELLTVVNPVDGNRPPVAVNDQYSTITNVPLITGNVLLNDSDADNDTLSIIRADTTSTNGARINNNQTGTFNYTPPNNFQGTDTFSYTVSDGQGGTDVATVFISVEQNNGPIAIDDKAKTNQNTPVTITNLLNNDISPTASPLSIVSVDNASQNGGSLQLNGPNSVTYTPPTDLTGQDYFIYKVSDGFGVATGQVQVDINAQPVAVSDAVYTYVNTTANTGNILVNDRDTNGDTLSVSSFDVSSARGGSISYNGDGTFDYEPPLNFDGNDSFDYIVDDGRGGSATATVFLAVIDPILRDDNRFLAFLNDTSPLHQENADSARAYYRAIDPADQRTSFNAWATLNGFNIGADAFAIYINDNDLGFTRRMFIRKDPINGNVASYVENYPNIADALAQINLIATVAMEYNVTPGYDPLDPEAEKFTTFYVFGADGNRDLGADLDGRGFKFVPGLCNVCHGGRPSALVNGVYPNFGNTGAGFIPWDLDTYAFEDATGTVSRAQQELQFKVLNQTILSTNPFPAVQELVEGWYGGTGLPANNFNGGYIPPGWRQPPAPAGATQLYTQVVAPNCRACHAMRGSPQQNDIDFMSYEKFIGYKSRIESLVFDESTMPLALRTFDKFWENPALPESLAAFLDSSKLLENDVVLTPGRPIANPGPFREAALGRVDLNGNGSLFTGGGIAFKWELVSTPANSQASLQNANQPNAFFIADVPGDYVARLVVNDGLAATPESPPGEVVIRVSPILQPISFISDVSPVFNQCAVCHLGFDNPRFNNLATLYDNVINFVNIDDPVNSRILTKPSGNHHGGGRIPGFETESSERYSTVLRWILEGARDN